MKLEESLSKARLGVLLKGSVFLSTIMLSMKHELDEAVPTAATNGLIVKYNPKFLSLLSYERRIGLVAHEVWHLALNHMVRGKDADHRIYNMAGDYVINLLLVTNGFEIPEEGLLDYKYAGWSTEEVYDDLIANAIDVPCDMDIQYATGEEEQDIEPQITEILVKAVTQSKLVGEAAGLIPNEITRLIDSLINPKLSWNDILFQYLTNKQKTDISWKKPNKRFFPKHILPTQYSDRLENITIAIDTSGSITDEMLRNILSEIRYIHEVLKPEVLRIIDCDCRINNIYEIDEYTDIMDLKFTGGGGTSFRPVLTYCETNTPTVLLYFTDLYGHLKQEETEYDLYWICYSKHPKAPFGTTIYYEYTS